MASLEIKSLGSPEEVRPFQDGKGAAHHGQLSPRGRWDVVCSSQVGAGRNTSSRSRAPTAVRRPTSATSCPAACTS